MTRFRQSRCCSGIFFNRRWCHGWAVWSSMTVLYTRKKCYLRSITEWYRFVFSTKSVSPFSERRADVTSSDIETYYAIYLRLLALLIAFTGRFRILLEIADNVV